MTQDLDHNAPPFSVSELSTALKRTVEGAFSYVRVRGEVGRVTTPRSGHCYLTLKDESAVLDAVIWKGSLGRLGVIPEEGMEVIATGKLSTYPGKSSYQMIVDGLELAGEGALLKLLEDRKRKLAAEGLFTAERKKPLPFLPAVIGVVTSPTGAVIRDILHRLDDRFPRHVLVWPVLVQGEGAAAQIAAAIRGFNALPETGGPAPRPDLLIVARGGGSLEDLMPFNEESVVRAAADSAIPLISAVGHETDTTLIDFAADRRAPTPTGAAEMAVPVRREVLARVRDDALRLDGAVGRLLSHAETRLAASARGIPDLGRLVDEARQRLDDRVERLDNAWPRLFGDKALRLSHAASGLRLDPLRREIERGGRELARLTERARGAYLRHLTQMERHLNQLGDRLTANSYESVLKRGYAVVWDGAGNPVTAAAGATPGAAWTVEFADGGVPVTVGEGTPPPPRPKTAPPKPRAKTDPTNQGSLF